jgi:hypothetical protein
MPLYRYRSFYYVQVLVQFKVHATGGLEPIVHIIVIPIPISILITRIVAYYGLTLVGLFSNPSYLPVLQTHPISNETLSFNYNIVITSGFLRFLVISCPQLYQGYGLMIG